MTASLLITQTSPGCVRYRLVDSAGTVLWQNRVEASDRGHEGARSRLAAWALAHGVTVKQAQRARVPVAVGSGR